MNSDDTRLTTAEARLRAIYEEHAFRVRSFRAEWLPDSSGYTTREPVPGAENESELVRYDAATGERSATEANARGNGGRSERLSPDGTRLLYSDKGNLFVRDLESGQVTPLTHDVPDGPISNDKAFWSLDGEGGAAVWSPDGRQVAIIQADYSQVRKRKVLVPSDPSYPELREDYFSRVGEKIVTLRVGVVNADGTDTRWLTISEPGEDFYLGQVSWAGNNYELLIEKLSRFRDQREFLLANVDTGEISAIFHESDPAWVVASIEKNLGLEWIDEGNAFLVLSEKDGWRHAYIYTRGGEELALITPGDFDVIERAKVDESRGWFYFYASPDNGTQKYLYRTNLDGTGKPVRITPMDQPGSHAYDFSPDGRWAFHTYSTFDTPPVTELVEMPEHRSVRVLEDNAELRSKVEALNLPPTEFLQLDIGDGVVMDTLMIKPPNFDPSLKYPVFVYVYGEPHSQTVLDRWGSAQADFHRAIAELGYLVVSIDNRGTPAPKGAAWRRSVFGSLGPLSTEEQAAGLKELGRTRPYVDMSRVGIWGWSGGGSNTLNAMFRKPDMYHVGIAVVPKPQPHLYNAWFQEIYMNTREVNPEGYRRAAAINYAEGLEGDLLIITGTGETNTHIEIIEGLVDRLIELGKQFDYMTYPNCNHGLREGRGTEVHVRMLIARYLLDHLPPGPR